MTDGDDASRRLAEQSSRQTSSHPERRRVQALDDAALVDAMRAGDEWAWSELVARARPVLDGYAERTSLREPDRTTCGGDLLTRVALHLAQSRRPAPRQLAPYLVRAAVRCCRQARRDRARRAAWYAAAAREDLALGLPDGQGVVGSVVSAHARRVAMAVDDAARDDAPERLALAASPAQRAIVAVAEALQRELSPAARQLLAWHADGVPHRQIAEWLGVSYAAAAKRIQRLNHRLAGRLIVLAESLPADEQRALAGVLGRAHASAEPTSRRAAPAR